eukprot:1507039-Prorocentrum_lima.AAC.1
MRTATVKCNRAKNTLARVHTSGFSGATYAYPQVFATTAKRNELENKLRRRPLARASRER